MVLGALAVCAQAFSSTPTTTTGGLPPCGTIDENGLNCQGLKKPDGICQGSFSTTYSTYYWGYYGGPACDCKKFCCVDTFYYGAGHAEHGGNLLSIFENGECDTTLVG